MRGSTLLTTSREKILGLWETLPSSLKTKLQKAWRIVALTIRTYGEIDGEQRAASFAYYVLFSLVPLCALLLAIGSLFVSSHDVATSIKNMLPLTSDNQRFIWETVRQLERVRGGVSLVSVVIFLWCSLRFFQALVRGVNRAWHTVEIPWWQLPLKNLIMIGITTSALVAGLLTPALLQVVRNILTAMETLILSHFPDFNLHLISILLDLTRYILGWAVLFYSFSMLYMFAPRRRVYFNQVWLPSLLVTLLLQACQIAFVNYLPRFVNYGIYEGLAGLMLLLFWVYVSGMIIILGGCLCAAMDRIWNEDAPPIPSTPKD
jgi:membrane protein